jgi:dihydroxyacid dehydratase/phosphogluconate dehydratase
VTKRLASGVLISGAVLLLVSACAQVGKMTHDMDTMIQKATTKADHEALATHYEQEAKALQAKAADHRSMGQAYAKSGGYAVTKGNLLQHCESLASTYERAAGGNLELAKQHRQLAEGAPK